MHVRRLEGDLPGQRSAITHHRLPEPVRFGRRPPEKPHDLPADASALWDSVVPILYDNGAADAVDGAVLEILVTQYARMKQAQRIVAEQGPLSLGHAGNLREHPALGIERNAAALVLKIAEMVGLSPVGRARLGIAAAVRRQTVGDGLADRIGPSPRLRAIDDAHP
jgi:P27 family predicted phage terminase small subunit